MNTSMIISVDAMGGDEGPEMVIPGLDLLLVRQPGLTSVSYTHLTLPTIYSV